MVVSQRDANEAVERQACISRTAFKMDNQEIFAVLCLHDYNDPSPWGQIGREKKVREGNRETKLMGIGNLKGREQKEKRREALWLFKERRKETKRNETKSKKETKRNKIKEN